MRYFHTYEVLAVLTGRDMPAPDSWDKGDTTYGQELMDFLLGDELDLDWRKVTSANLQEMLNKRVRRCAAAVLRQHPEFGDVDTDSITEENHRDWAKACLDRFGESIGLQPVNRASV